MCWNGAKIGMAVIAAMRRLTLRVLRRGPAACIGAVAGTTVLPAVALPTVAAAFLAIAATTLGSVLFFSHIYCVHLCYKQIKKGRRSEREFQKYCYKFWKKKKSLSFLKIILALLAYVHFLLYLRVHLPLCGSPLVATFAKCSPYSRYALTFCRKIRLTPYHTLTNAHL